MSLILTHPFQILPNGRVATVEQGTDQANAQQLAVLILTRLDERPLEPGFGIPDPTYDQLHPNAIIAAVTAYGPDVTIGDITNRPDGNGTQLVQIDFS